MHGDARAVVMSWRRFLRRIARPSPGRGRAAAEDDPRGGETRPAPVDGAIPAALARLRAGPPGERVAAGSSGDGARAPLDEPHEDEAPVLDEAELRALREELAQELERLARRQREAAS